MGDKSLHHQYWVELWMLRPSDIRSIGEQHEPPLLVQLLASPDETWKFDALCLRDKHENCLEMKTKKVIDKLTSSLGTNNNCLSFYINCGVDA